MLSGVKLADLRSIMQFIYTGEVSVSEDDLPDLLEVAEMLGVRGLKSGHEKTKERAEDVEESDESRDVSESNTDLSDTSRHEDVQSSISITKVSPPPPAPEEDQTESSPQSTQSSSTMPSESFQISVKKNLTSELGEAVTDDVIQADEKSDSLPSPLLPPVTSQYSPYFPPAPYSLTSPLVSMTNLAAMYQQSSPTKLASKERNVSVGQQRPLDWYRQASQEGKVALDLLPEDINSIMSQSTTPYCPICNKDCANFPNLRSHLQVRAVTRSTFETDIVSGARV